MLDRLNADLKEVLLSDAQMPLVPLVPLVLWSFLVCGIRLWKSFEIYDFSVNHLDLMIFLNFVLLMGCPTFCPFPFFC